MTDLEEALRMLAVAEVDLKAARNMLAPELFADSVFGFHAQQAVEKALKAWLSLHSVAYPKTHDIRVLMNLLQTEIDEDCGPILDLADLTDFAVQFRYDFPTPTQELARVEILVRVESLWNRVANLARHNQILV